MASYTDLKAAIAAVIKANGQQAITGQKMQDELFRMIDSLGATYGYIGKATPSTNPGTPDGKVFYFATEPDVYPNFGNLTVSTEGLNILTYDPEIGWEVELLLTSEVIDTNAIHVNESNEISALTEKSTPVDSDITIIEDSADSGSKKKLSWANIKATLKTYFDSFYISITASNQFSTVTEKESFADNDVILGEDSEASGGKKKWTWSTFKSVLKTYFDTLYRSVTANIPTSYIELNKDESADHLTLLDEHFAHSSSPYISEGADITDNGDGTISISEAEAWMKVENDIDSQFKAVVVPERLNIAITQDQNYIVYIDYNSGTPQFSAMISVEGYFYTNWDKIPFATAINIGTRILINNFKDSGTNEPFKNVLSLINYSPLRYLGGLIGSDLGTRYFSVTGGVLLLANDRITVAPINTNTGSTFTRMYVNNGTWTRVTGETQVDNTQYNDVTTGLVALDNNKYVNKFLYYIVDTPSLWIVVEGQTQYLTQASAEQSSVPSSLPPELSRNYAGGILVAKIVMQQGDAEIQSILSPFTVTFSGSAVAVTSHNLLNDIQGGEASFRGHTTQDEYNGITGANGGLSADNVALSESDIGTNVQAYDANIVSDADYATDKARLADTSGTNTGDQDLSGYEQIGATADVTVTWTSAKTATQVLAEINALPKNGGGYKLYLYIDDITADIDAQMTFKGLYNYHIIIEATTAVLSSGLAQNAELNFNSAYNIKFEECSISVEVNCLLNTLNAGQTTLPFSVVGGNTTISTKFNGYDTSAATSEVYLFNIIGSRLISTDDKFKGNTTYNTNLANLTDSVDNGRGGELVVINATYDTTQLTYAANGYGTVAFGGTNTAFVNDTANDAIDISQTGSGDVDIALLSNTSVSSIEDDTVQINGQFNRAGTIYWMIVSNGSSYPTVAEIVGGDTGAIGYVADGTITAIADTLVNGSSGAILSAATDYDLYYVALDSIGNASEKKLVEFTTALTQLTAPTIGTATVDSATAVTVEVTNNDANADYLQAEYKLSTDSTWTVASSTIAISATEYQFTGLTQDLQHDFRFKSLGSSPYSDSDYSSIVQATPEEQVTPIMTFATTSVSSTWAPIITPSSGTLIWEVVGYGQQTTNTPSFDLSSNDGSALSVNVYANDVTEGTLLNACSFYEKLVVGELDFSYFVANNISINFKNNVGLTNVYFSDGNNQITNLYFNNTALSSLDLTDVTINGELNFGGVSALSSITWGANSHSISDLTILNNAVITTLSIPSSVTISNILRLEISSLTSYTRPTIEPSITSYSLYNCSLDDTGIDAELEFFEELFNTNTPTGNLTITLNGSNMGTPTATGLADKALIEGYFTTAGYTATINVNS